MPNQTTNYGFKKPLENEYYDITIQNENADKIDSAIKARKDEIDAHKVSTSAHAAQHITYNGNASNNTNSSVKKALDDIDDRIDNLVATVGDSNTEIVDARDNLQGQTYPTLKDRLDTEYNRLNEQLAETVQLQKFQRNAERSLVIPTYDGSGQTVHPSVKYFDSLATAPSGYKYWMAHTPYPNSDDDYENPCIAVSNDGIQWSVPNGLTNPIDQPTAQEISDGYHMSDTHLVVVNGVLECWYRFNKNGVVDKIFRKTSIDGISWSAREVVLDATDKVFLSPAILFENGKYRLWYMNGYNIYYIESQTGQLGTWTNPVLVPISYRTGEPSVRPWHLDVFKDTDGKYYLILNAITNFGLPNRTQVLMFGKSNDGMSFNDTYTFLYPTPKDSVTNWDNNELYRASMVRVGSMYRLYYSAISSRNTWGIGLLEGDSVENVNRVDITKNSNGDTINLKNLILKQGQQLNLDEGLRSYLKNDRLKLVKPGVAGAGLLVLDNNTLKVISDSGDLPAILEIKGLSFQEGIVLSNKEGYFYYNRTKKRYEYYNGSAWKSLQMIEKDITNNRPTTGTETGQMFFDATLNKPIWRNKTNDGWVDATGATV
ncbi:hypothetical protein [Robertmurraya andreesenii]|uniref:Uncharacterized protein n=1 Tax=Anoxybacillus andreesenii TaxID=1325932 RepID=A0ABT9V1S8_9BACL|nr:hypothetical protein [Robertmurraya andreesenii]MDQ0154901.1 hypothetical protein [Robertmurraya andreesenii]